jgi:sulfur dioxygenase
MSTAPYHTYCSCAPLLTQALLPHVKSSIAAASGAAGDIQLHDGDIISIGSLEMYCLATPGHTDGCMTYYLPSPVTGASGMVFTGDTLLIRACGRTDFQQGEVQSSWRTVGSVGGKMLG